MVFAIRSLILRALRRYVARGWGVPATAEKNQGDFSFLPASVLFACRLLPGGNASVARKDDGGFQLLMRIQTCKAIAATGAGGLLARWR